MAHLISWNAVKGQIRDSQVALPVVSLSVPGFPEDLADNSLAHIALLGPRELERAYRFALQLRVPGRMRQMRRLVWAYLRKLEANKPKFERWAVQHRKTLKNLYCLSHDENASDGAKALLFHRVRPENSLASVIRKLRLESMSATEAAGTIIENRVPFLIAQGTMKKRMQDPDVLLALIQRMSATELMTHMKQLEKLGVRKNPALRGALDEALKKSTQDRNNVLKTTKAAEEVEDEELRVRLHAIQDKRVEMLGVEGNWLVLADRSPSMSRAVALAKQVAAVLAKMVKGKVWLVFFDSTPMTVDVTGLSLDQIEKATGHITAGGSGTSIGCGLKRMLDEKIAVDGIAIVSDAKENTAPLFTDTYRLYSKFLDKEVPVYLYRCETIMTGQGDRDLAHSMRAAGVDLQEFDLRVGKVDYYSLPNLVKTMRTNRYSLIDEVMGTRLLTLSEVLPALKKGETVHA